MGDRIHRNTRITDAGNACNHCTNNQPNVLLHLLHSHKPVLKLTSNYATGSCYNDHDATLSLHYPGQPLYSTLETDYDLALVSWASGNNLVLSTRNHEAHIKLATTPSSAAADVERMRITPIGHVGIWQTDPKELLHVGSRMTFHVGYVDDYLGYNCYRVSGGVDKLIVGTAGTALGYALKYGMTRYGQLEIGVGSTESGAADSGGHFDTDFSGHIAADFGGHFNAESPDHVPRY